MLYVVERLYGLVYELCLFDFLLCFYLLSCGFDWLLFLGDLGFVICFLFMLFCELGCSVGDLCFWVCLLLRFAILGCVSL